jgi:hypothetical protein
MIAFHASDADLLDLWKGWRPRLEGPVIRRVRNPYTKRDESFEIWDPAPGAVGPELADGRGRPLLSPLWAQEGLAPDDAPTLLRTLPHVIIELEIESLRRALQVGVEPPERFISGTEGYEIIQTLPTSLTVALSAVGHADVARIAAEWMRIVGARGRAMVAGLAGLCALARKATVGHGTMFHYTES